MDSLIAEQADQGLSSPHQIGLAVMFSAGIVDIAV